MNTFRDCNEAINSDSGRGNVRIRRAHIYSTANHNFSAKQE